jgi:DNA-binding transcriptional regulator GbsR (MarR family)
MHTATSAIVERFGLLFEQQGYPRIAGRLTGFLLLSDGPRSLDDISAALDVSKASVSTDARRMESRGFLQRTSVPGDRRDYYAIAPDGFRTSLRSHIEALRRFDELLGDTSRIPSTSPTVRKRIAEWTAFHRDMITSLDTLLEHWSEAPAARAGKRPVAR